MGVNAKSGLAVAVDVGTTTIAVCALDSASGDVIARRGALNPQSEWGPDVLSRIEAIANAPDNLEKMSSALAGAINGLVADIVDPAQVVSVGVAGNTVMGHIFARVSPAPLAKVPYKPVFKEAKILDARDVGLVAGPGAKVYLFPSIGGFVGGDAVAVMLALGFGLKHEVALAIDIGTNSEIMLGGKGACYATSAAAGPAFEAGGISSGMIAAPGAIERVLIADDELNLQVIGNQRPRGICGSGIISAVSAMLGAGVIDGLGRVKDRVELDTNIGNRIKNDVSGNAFTLYRGPGIDIRVTQADIRNLQNAKAAIRAGISMLLAKAELTPKD
ncbi:MAG: ASKHA domain-containing protein, partial [Nitrospirota bacterium]|nr:ASKHA domain-containing protein [Nitrospirota bacterium]